MLTVLTQRTLKLAALGLVNIRRTILGKRLPRPEIYYFAYGANLDPKRFEKYGMNVVPIGVARLDNYALKFALPCEYVGKGYASIEPVAGKTVWGFLYQLDWCDILLLDAMEYVFLNHYRKVEVTVELKDGTYKSATALRTGFPTEGLLPSTEYKNMILKSAKMHGFPAAYISELELVPSWEIFPLDHGFSLALPSRRRPFLKTLRPVYSMHDRFREWLCELLRF